MYEFTLPHPSPAPYFSPFSASFSSLILLPLFFPLFFTFLSYSSLLFPFSLSLSLFLSLHVRFVGALPLDKSKISSIALVGPSGDATRTMQGNYYVRQGLRNAETRQDERKREKERERFLKHVNEKI